jgi:hypothetical protein
MLLALSFLRQDKGSLESIIGFGEGVTITFPLVWYPLLVGTIWVIAGLRLKAFLDKPSLVFDRSRYSMLFLLIWSVPSLLHPAGLSVALVSLLAVEVILQALRPESKDEAIYHAFIAGIYIGLMFLVRPWSALMSILFLSILRNAGLLTWRAVVWIVIGALVPWAIICGIDYVAHGIAYNVPLVRPVSEEISLDLKLHWSSLVWVTMGAALLLQSTYAVILLTSTASSKQRILHNAAMRSLLFMFLILVLWSLYRGSWSHVALLSVPASILLSVSVQSLSVLFRLCFWIWLISAVLMFAQHLA